jgi:hypothetical protein
MNLPHITIFDSYYCQCFSEAKMFTPAEISPNTPDLHFYKSTLFEAERHCIVTDVLQAT